MAYLYFCAIPKPHTSPEAATVLQVGYLLTSVQGSVLLYSPVCEEKAGDGERDAGQAGQEKHLVGHHWRSETWQVWSEDQSESVISLPPSVSVA